jgi:hypothetical protein
MANSKRVEALKAQKRRDINAFMSGLLDGAKRGSLTKVSKPKNGQKILAR